MTEQVKTLSVGGFLRRQTTTTDQNMDKKWTELFIQIRKFMVLLGFAEPH